MTPRPGFVSKRRPLSAIFLGDSASTPSPSNLPDLPEPPSPSAESDHSYASGLPSPPATNSTGSGGDKSADGGSIRRRSVSDTIANMPKPYDSISSTNIRHSRSSSPGDDEEGNEDDSTARFDHLRRRSSQTSAENAATLQRVLSLTQRNRMALDKLSRLNTPSPSGRQSRSPLPPLTGPSPASSSTSSSSPASSRQSAHSHSRSFPTTRDHDPGLSGSETERDRQSYSSDEVSSTPPSTISRRTDPRARTTSMPDSPQRRRSRSRASSPGPSATIQRTPRKRVSLASEPDSNVTHAALAAVASMRRSPTQGLGGRSRQPLPKEFFDAKRRSSDGRTSKEPTTPQKASYRALANSPSPRLVNPPLRDSSLQVSPHRGQPRFSTVRELSHKHQIRWQSEDLNAHGYNDEMTTTGRRQYQRAGSMENTLGARLVGDSLRAAGIGMRKEGGGEVFSSGHTQQSQSSDSDPWYEGSENRVRNGPSRASSILSDPRTPANRESRSRPPTSMADTADIAPRTAPPGVRTYKATFLERNREGIGSARASPRPSEDSPTPLRTPQFAERTYGSPRPRSRDFSATEHSGNNGRQSSMADEQPIEHLKLVSEALTVFETQLSRLPLMGDTTTATVPNLFRDAQAIVRSAEQVNSMLRIGTNRALERQIDSEVDEEDSGAIDMVQLWQDVGADFRDCLRSSDELVRTLANFLVGAGKVLREATAVSNGPGMQQHLRAASLDAGGAAIVNGNDARSSTASGSGKSSARSSGLRAESRLSWEATRDIKRNSSRAEHRSSLQVRERDTNSAYTPESEAPPQPAISPRPSLTSSSSMRRIYSPRPPEAGDTSLEYDGVDPSPTPPARHQSSATTERLRSLAPIAIPQQAEPEANSAQTPLNRRTTVPDRSINRRKASNTSNITIRPVPTFAVPPTPSATTALTPATASSNRTPNRTSVPVQRSTLDGANSSKKPGISVTLSRAASAVQRKRTTSSTSPAEVSDQHAYAATPVYGKPVRAGREEESKSASRTTFGRRSASIVASAGVPATVGRTIGSERKERRRTITEIFSS